MNNNEATGISIQDLEQWFDEELELYGTKDKSDFESVFAWKHSAISQARLRIINKAKKKIQEQSQAKLNSERINKVIQVLIEYGLAEDCSGSELIEVGPKGLDDIVQELNKALE